MKEGKPFPTKLLVLLCLTCGAGLAILSLTKDDDASMREAARQALETTLEKIVGIFPKGSESSGRPSSDGSSVVTASIAPEHARTTEVLFEKMFLKKGDSYFTQSRWGAQPIPYELKNFELLGPKELQANEGDRMNGIERRVSYEIRVRAYRVYDPNTKVWGEWNPDNPPRLSALTLVQQNGDWSVVSDPSELYAVK